MKPPWKLTTERPWRVLSLAKGQSNLVGYARVSTRDQHLHAQLTALEAAGCSKIYAEKVSAGHDTRLGWQACREALRPRDTVVVVRVDRLGRRLAELVRTLDELRELGVNVRALEEGLDTTERGGRFAFTVIAALAEKVRDDIKENTRAGLAELRSRGQVLGRPSKLDAPKISQVTHLRAQGYSLRDIARTVQVAPGTVRRALWLAQQREPSKQLQLEGT